jgi:cyclin B
MLVAWLVEVHLKFKLLPETLFLTVNIIDRFTFLRQVKKTDYQLLGITAMLIASKYEEIYAPEIRDFIYMTDHAYSKDQVLAQESAILRALDFNVTAPSAYRFLERFLKLSLSDDLIGNFGRYIIELALMNADLYKWRPS